MCEQPCTAAIQVFYLVLHEQKPRVPSPLFYCMFRCPHCTRNQLKAIQQREATSDKDLDIALL